MKKALWYEEIEILDEYIIDVKIKVIDPETEEFVEKKKVKYIKD